MKKTCITLTGTNHYFGTGMLQAGAKLRLVKEPDNRYDHEAIRVEIEGLGTVGYVANSVCTVQGETVSAGRLYDRIGDTARAKVLFVWPGFAICKVSKKSLLGGQAGIPRDEAAGGRIPPQTVPDGGADEAAPAKKPLDVPGWH